MRDAHIGGPSPDHTGESPDSDQPHIRRIHGAFATVVLFAELFYGSWQPFCPRKFAFIDGLR